MREKLNGFFDAWVRRRCMEDWTLQSLRNIQPEMKKTL
jgi:hypothetical protein